MRSFNSLQILNWDSLHWNLSYWLLRELIRRCLFLMCVPLCNMPKLVLMFELSSNQWEPVSLQLQVPNQLSQPILRRSRQVQCLRWPQLHRMHQTRLLEMLQLNVPAPRHLHRHLSYKLPAFSGPKILPFNRQHPAISEQHWQIYSSAVFDNVFDFAAVGGGQSNPQEGNLLPRVHFRAGWVLRMGQLGVTDNTSDYLQHLGIYVLWVLHLAGCSCDDFDFQHSEYHFR